jgi:hypothetical protein
MTLRNAAYLLLILLAYGIVGRMDYEDELRREKDRAEMTAYTRALVQCVNHPKEQQ